MAPKKKDPGITNHGHQKRKVDKSKSKLPILCDTDESSSETEESEDDLDTFDEEQNDMNDLPSEFWQIQKLVRYLKIGKPTATVLALCALRDCTFEDRVCQKAFKESEGLAMTLNLLETGVLRCQIGALKLLRKIAHHPSMRHAIVDLGGLESMVDNLDDPSLQLRRLVAETVSLVATSSKASRIVRKRGAIPYLVDLLDIKHEILDCPEEKMSWKDLLTVHGAQYGARALWTLSTNTKNKKIIWKAGAVPLLGALLKSTHVDLLIPVVGTIQECASQVNYRTAVRDLKMLADIERHLENENVELKQYCASAVFKCAEDQASREIFGKQGGLVPLVGIIGRGEYHSNKNLMKAATGAIWKCALSLENVKLLQQLGVVQTLVQLLLTQPEEVLVNVVGAIGMCAQLPANNPVIRKAGGIEPLVRLLSRTNYPLVENVTQAVGECARDPENLAIIERLDGVRLVWSHLKSLSPAVQASAAWALCPCIENVKDSADMVRSFVGGLELIVNLLQSRYKKVLVAVCAATACIARDEENLAVLTDYNIVRLLAKLANIKYPKLQHKLAEAIAACCPWSTNRLEFGEAGVVVPLVKYLRSPDNDVKCATVHALYQLSMEQRNCVTMHTHGVVKPLLSMVENKDEKVQRSAAGCLQNIRMLAMTKEKLRIKTPSYLSLSTTNK